MDKVEQAKDDLLRALHSEGIDRMGFHNVSSAIAALIEAQIAAALSDSSSVDGSKT